MLPCALLLCAVVAWSQEARIEQARQFGRLDNLPGQTQEEPATSTIDVSAGQDTDSFGLQQMLREQEKIRPFSTYAGVSALVTNNVALTRRETRSDSFLVATFGLGYRRPLPNGFQLEAGARITAFRYDLFHQLNFNSVDAGVGFSYHTDKLGGIDFNLGYGFTDLLDTNSTDSFFTNHTFTLGAQKTFAFSQAHYAFVGVLGQLGLSDPKIDQRSEFSAFAGYHLKAARKWDIDLLYQYAYFAYSEGGRRDNNQIITLGTRYNFTEWCSVFATSYYIFNNSNQHAFNYQAGTVGVGLTFSSSF